jgi:peptidoglycan/LPS O-acetylase OafA/YrhL
VVLPFVVLAFGLSHHAWLSRSHERDYSYGIYIYAFPVQQSLVSFWPQMPLVPYLLSTLTLTIALAAASWHFVEKPALKHKPFRG